MYSVYYYPHRRTQLPALLGCLPRSETNCVCAVGVRFVHQSEVALAAINNNTLTNISVSVGNGMSGWASSRPRLRRSRDAVCAAPCGSLACGGDVCLLRLPTAAALHIHTPSFILLTHSLTHRHSLPTTIAHPSATARKRTLSNP